jgi:hypothetical protein
MKTRAGNTFLVCFLAFGAAMCTLTVLLLVFPGTRADLVWSVNPEARRAFRTMGWLAFPLMTAVGAACAAAAFGLARQREWGRRLAILILSINLVGDVAGAILRHDPRTLIGIPIGGAMILFLVRQGPMINRRHS